MCRNIRLLLAYDGTGFSGWQRQDGQSTVQGVIEEALATLHKAPVTLTGSGRTDAGVHAAGQVANFYTSLKNMEAPRFVPALNSLLPRDVRILEAGDTRDDFHARFDARLRTYRYFFMPRGEALPWELRYACPLHHHVNLARLNDYARLFRGEMDCSAFTVPGDKSKSRSRYISGASFYFDGRHLVFEISANAFLWKMVRTIAGTLVRFDKEGLSPARLKEVIESRDFSLSGPASPPQGLFLWKIDYFRE